MVSYWDFIRRIESGEIIAEADYDRKIGQVAQDMVQKYDIRYTPDDPVPADDALADRVFEAAIELFMQLGIFVIDTRKVVTFERDEIEEALAHVPAEVVYGTGNERVVVPHRMVEDERDPIVFFSAVGTPVPEEDFVKICMSYVQEPLADTFSGPLITTYRGMPIASGSPVEVEAGIWNVIKLREAAQFAGRPDISIHNFMSIAERTDATIAAARPEFGVREGDGLFTAAIAEMKVDYERLKRIAFQMHTPYVIGGLYGPLMGGYAGGPEATAIVLVAHHFLGLFAFRAHRHNGFPININQTCNTTREMLWLVSVSGQAIARNTKLVTVANAFMASGPCTEMITYELAAHSLAATVSGWHLNPSAVARNRFPSHCSGMEPRMHAEVGHVAARAGITRKDASKIVNKLLDFYEKDIKTAPKGKSFRECYDIETVQPTEEYTGLWKKSRSTLHDMGLDFTLLNSTGG
jgi:methylamine--corrinoid protein Co-methyltransferase